MKNKMTEINTLISADVDNRKELAINFAVPIANDDGSYSQDFSIAFADGAEIGNHLFIHLYKSIGYEGDYNFIEGDIRMMFMADVKERGYCIQLELHAPVSVTQSDDGVLKTTSILEDGVLFQVVSDAVPGFNDEIYGSLRWKCLDEN